MALSTVAFLIPERPQLLLEACLLAPPQRLEAWQHWLHLTRFDDVDIASFDLLPAVCHFNRGQPFAEMDRLRGLFRHNWAINQERLSAVLPLLSALQTEGFEPIPIKGVALAFTTYGSLGARRIADVDVLVDEDRFMGAAALAARLGFEPASGWIWPRAGSSTRRSASSSSAPAAPVRATSPRPWATARSAPATTSCSPRPPGCLPSFTPPGPQTATSGSLPD